MVFSLEYKICISIYVQYLLITSKSDCNKYLSDRFSLFSFVNYAPAVIKTFLQSCIIFFYGQVYGTARANGTSDETTLFADFQGFALFLSSSLSLFLSLSLSHTSSSFYV